MIIDKFLDILFSPALALFIKLSDIDFSIPDNVFEGIEVFLITFSNIIPLKAVMPIFISSFSIKAFQIVWALIIRIKSFIPTMGA